MQPIFEKNRIHFENPDGQLIGEVYFPTVGNTTILEHTFVDPAFEGQGIGRQLVTQFVSYAKSAHLQVVLLCPFAKREFQKHPEYQTILKENSHGSK